MGFKEFGRTDITMSSMMACKLQLLIYYISSLDVFSCILTHQFCVVYNSLTVRYFPVDSGLCSTQPLGSYPMECT